MLLILPPPQVLVAVGQEGGTFWVEKLTNWLSHPPVWRTCDGTRWCLFAASGMLTCRSSHQAIARTVPELGGVR